MEPRTIFAVLALLTYLTDVFWRRRDRRIREDAA